MEHLTSEKKKITPKEAAIKAGEYFQEIYGAPRRDVTVEEIEMDEAGTYWLVTLGYLGSTGAPFSFAPEQIYKRFKVDVYTGDVISMKIRKV